MVKLLQEIYEQVVVTEDGAKEMDRRIAGHVNGLAEEYAGQLGGEDTEALKDLMYSAALKAGQEGFQLGIQFMLEVMFGLYADSVGQ